MSGLFGSITIRGNRLTEFAAQTASVGMPIPFGYGKFPVSGNVIFAALPPTEHVKKKKQGKGGVKSEEYSYTLSYAVAFCEGPIFGYWTIKRNGKVVWTQDPNASVEDRAYAAKWAQKATFYYGTETQLPDSTMEAYKGAGRVSGHRGLAYIVVEDDDVTDGAGAVPTYEAVVIRGAAKSYTTPPYPVYAVEGIGVDLAPFGGIIRGAPGAVDVFNVSHATPLGGEIKNVIQAYSLAEKLSILPITPLGGEIKNVIRQYELKPEEISISSITPLGGEIKTGVLVYSNYKPENFDVSLKPLGGEIE